MRRVCLLLLAVFFFSQIEAQADIKAEILSSIPIKLAQTRMTCSKSINTSTNYLYIIDGLLMAKNTNNFLFKINPSDIQEVEVLKGIPAFSCFGNYDAIILIKTKNYKRGPALKTEYPFRVCEIKNKNWSIQQDIYNSITAKVPGVTITFNVNKLPMIRMRGDRNTVVVVDGVRYNISILQTLNPSDIEKIQISNSSNATNYFLGKSY